MEPLEASQRAVCLDVCLHRSRFKSKTATHSIIQYLCSSSWKNISLVFSSTTDWFSFPSSCLGPSFYLFIYFLACFFLHALHLALLSDFLPSRLRRVSAAAAAAVSVWLHGNSISQQCDRRSKRLERGCGEQGWRGKLNMYHETNESGFKNRLYYCKKSDENGVNV